MTLDPGLGSLGGQPTPSGPTNPLDPKVIAEHQGIDQFSSQRITGIGTIIAYNDGTTAFIPESETSRGVVVGGRIVDPATGRLIYEPPDSGGGGATGGQVLANAQQAAALAEQQRQFDLMQGERKAREDQQQRLAEQTGLGGLEVSRGNLAVNQGNLALGQGRLSLDQLKQQFDQYNTLAQLASNPRNFVQTFFMNRGFQPPADVARYGNTSMTAADIPNFGQFRQQAAPRQLAPASAYPSGPLSTPPTAQGGGYASPYEGLSGFSKTGAPYRLAPNDPDAAGLMAKYPGMYQVTGQEEAMKYLPQPRMMARGGTLRMTGPHAVIDLMSGKVRAIAGEAGPENAYFDGAAIIDPTLSGDIYGDQNQYLPGYGPGFDVGVAGTETQQTGSQYLPGSEPTPYNVPSVPSQSVPQQTWTAADLQAMIAAANAGNQTRTTAPTGPAEAIQQPTTYPQVYQQPLAPQIQQVAPAIDSDAAAATAYYQNFIKNTMNQPLPVVGTGEPAPTQNAYSTFQQTQTAPAGTTPGGATPISLGGSPTATNPQNAVTPASPGTPTFGQPIPSRMPTFLAGEDFQGASPVLRALQQAQAVPPFLQRTFAQARGESAQGTNVPQRTDLPPDLPLISRLGWEQLSPSEQQAFLSYASSLGVTPEDYLALIFGSSPQGGAASSPTFGAPLRFLSQ